MIGLLCLINWVHSAFVQIQLFNALKALYSSLEELDIEEESWLDFEVEMASLCWVQRDITGMERA